MKTLIIIPITGILLGVSVLNALFGAYVVHMTWQWHVVTSFGIEPPPLLSLLAIITALSAVTGQYNWYAIDREKKNSDFFRIIAYSFVRWAIVLAFSFLAKVML